jgi:hypothetical protein
MANWSGQWDALPCTLREGLQGAGFDGPDLFSLAFGENEGLEEYSALAQQVGYLEDDGGDLILGLVNACASRVRRAPSRVAAITDSEILVWASKRQKVADAERLAEVQLPIRRIVAPPPGRAPPARWPKRAERKLAAATTANAKDAVEAEERNRWLEAAQELAVAAGLPVVKRTLGTPFEHALRPALAQGVRTTTLRKRVRDARKLSAFMVQNFGEAWPQRIEHVLDYVLTRAAEPCGPSVPLSIQACLYFFEKGGGVAQADMMARDPLLENVLADLLRDLRSNRPMAVAAPREPVALVAARERLVLDTEQKPYRRAYAWWKNLQVWSSLRFGDHLGLKMSTMRLSNGVLRGSMLETKTTGKDKKQGSRAFVVSAECYLIVMNPG